MSRREASETVKISALRRMALPIMNRAYCQAARLGRYWGKSRWMQSWIVTTAGVRHSSGST
ncbi:MAG: hypothetical protein DMF81_10680 [Acidobacteria bacterium]|nr:MAG: hypothetical protein DMF81_10680 [Acidobacteriota bacterium]